MMNPQTSKWLHEAHDAIDSSATLFTKTNSMNALACEGLFTGIEKAIKAPIVEQYGTIPGSFQTHRLVTICKKSGLWQIFDPGLQGFLLDIDRFGPEVRYPGELAYETLVSSSTNQEWKSRLADAQRLLGVVESTL